MSPHGMPAPVPALRQDVFTSLEMVFPTVGPYFKSTTFQVIQHFAAPRLATRWRLN